MRNFILVLAFIIEGTLIGTAQGPDCDRYYIFDLRDSTINSDPVVVFKMYTDINTANNGSYTSLSFVHQNGDTLNPRPNYSFSTPVANTTYDTLEYVVYLNQGFTRFPADFNGILLMEVPYCEIPYNHALVSIPDTDRKEITIEVFPNPTSGQVLILNKSNIKITSIEMYAASGKLIRSKSNHFDEIRTHELNAGVYYIRVYAGSHLMATKRIIKN